MKSGYKKLLTGAGFAAALGGGYLAAADYLTRLAIDREPPKGLELLSKNVATDGNVTEFPGVAEATETLKNLPLERIEITAWDGTKLTAHWYPAENAKRIFIGFHGWRSNWYRDFSASTPYWHDASCSILYVEQRTRGGSEGECMGMGLLERFDCLDWIRWTEEHIGTELPIYLVGISMGATTVMMAAGLELPDCVKGLVADCGFTSPDAILSHVVGSTLHIPYRMFREPINRAFKRRTGFRADAVSTVDCLKNNKLPIMFIHGADDHFVPVEMTYENYAACPSEKFLFIAPGADHGVSYLIDTPGYHKMAADFWKACEG